MTAYVHEKAALRILEWLHHAEDALVGHAVVTFNGEAGTCKEVCLDELHGLCFTIDDPISGFDEIECGVKRRWYPVSTIRHKEIADAEETTS